jgi:glycosyltransferase involved in cell wall biosynthesis
LDRRTALTVSGTIPPDLQAAVAEQRRPRVDYQLLADRLGADLIDYTEARHRAGRLAKLIRRFAGDNALLAWTCFKSRKHYRAIVTDGEQVGIPYAALSWFGSRSSGPTHSMIVHIMSVRKKVILFKGLCLKRRIDRMFVYASRQREFAVTTLHMRPEQVRLTSFMVDTEFFSTERVVPHQRRMICAAGLEFRDYDTLVEAVRDLDVEVVIAAASPWSKRTSDVGAAALPTNVTLCKLSLFELRQLYADALFVVVPLHESDFQAGVTTILEAMAMSKAVVCSRTAGQTDVIVAGDSGLYVKPGDVQELRNTICTLLDDPAESQRLGEGGRRWVVANADISIYADRIARAVLEIS